jgi:hypothetical protein
VSDPLALEATTGLVGDYDILSGDLAFAPHLGIKIIQCATDLLFD